MDMIDIYSKKEYNTQDNGLEELDIVENEVFLGWSILRFISCDRYLYWMLRSVCWKGT